MGTFFLQLSFLIMNEFLTFTVENFNTNKRKDELRNF